MTIMLLLLGVNDGGLNYSLSILIRALRVSFSAFIEKVVHSVFHLLL
jgi:hypothetical protein